MQNKGFASDLYPEFVVLGFLFSQDLHGYEIFNQVEADLSQIWRLSLSQIYNLLKRLENQAYIQGELQKQIDRPAKKVFHLTPEGKAHFTSWLFSPCGSSIRAIRVEFLTKLFFLMRYFPQEIPVHLQQQIDTIEKDLVELNQTKTELLPQNTSSIAQLAMDLRIRHLETMQQWLVSYQKTLSS